MAVLKTSGFVLELIYGENVVYVNVGGLDYSVKHMLYIEKEGYKKFIKSLEKLYLTLAEGEARIQEFYEQDYICFRSDGLGYFDISGDFENVERWHITFYETVDQTYFKNFINELKREI